MEPNKTDNNPATPSPSPQTTTPTNPAVSSPQPAASSTPEVFGGRIADTSENPAAVSGGTFVPPTVTSSGGGFLKKFLNNKPLFLGTIGAVVVLGGAAAYYFGFYMNPSVVFKQSLNNTGKGYEKLVDYLDTESKKNYKGYKGDGSYRVGSGSFATDGKLSFHSNGGSSDGTFDVNAGATRVALEERIIETKAATPDIYFKVSGLASIKSLLGDASPTINAAITKYDGQWIMFDKALLDKVESLSGASAGSSATATEPTPDQISDEEHAFGKVNQDYLFSSDKNKGVLTVVKNLGSEKVDGHKTYHYKVALVKDNVKKYITAQRDALKASKLNSWIKANDYENYVDLAYDSLQQSANNIKSTDTFELWADSGQRLVYKIRFADKSNPANSYVDIGQDHKGGTSYPFFINFYDKSSSSTVNGSFVMTLDTKQNDVNFKLTAKGTGTNGFDLSANFLLQPTNDVSPITAPTGSFPLTQVLNDLGLSPLLDYAAAAQPAAAAPSSGIQGKAEDSKRQTDINSLQTQLEAFFSQNGYYPSLADMNNTSWLVKNMKSLDLNSLQDPQGSSKTLAASPAAKVYAYKVSNIDGGSCESDDTVCAQYKLTATLSNGTQYSKASLN